MTDPSIRSIRRELERARDELKALKLSVERTQTSVGLALDHLAAFEKEWDVTQPAPHGSTFDELVPELPKKFNPVDWRKDVLVPAPYKPQVEVVKTPEPVVAAEPLIETPEWSNIMNLVLNTKEHLFITGGAGVGKSSMLEQVVKQYPGNLLVVAFTGIAALRVGGSTIHREFRLKPQALERDDVSGVTDPKKRAMLKALDAVLVDEVSMTRADVMDAMDIVLQKTRGSKEPFGGVRILAFGDLFQLPPVATDSKEKSWLKHRYGTELPYFFHAECWRDTQPKICELTTVFRQQDKDFAGALNAIRKGALTPEHMALINGQHKPTFTPPADELWLTLTTTNASADVANRKMLDAINSPAKVFTAEIDGDFRTKDAPTDTELKLKVGANVLFIRNDNVNRHWMNGTLGKVTNLDPLWVKTDKGEFHVEQEIWKSLEYDYDPVKKKLVANERGRFVQVPLKHASAITVHRSQGQTYDRCIVDLSGGTFASGQAYVSLSRCRTLKGMVLRRALRDEDVKVDDEVLAFMSGRPIAKPEPAQPALFDVTKETTNE